MPNERLLWAALGMLVVLITVTGFLVFGSLFFAPTSNDAVKSLIEARGIQKAIVLFLIVPTIAVLCVQERVTGEAALAALSAIAGYVLGSAQ